MGFRVAQWNARQKSPAYRTMFVVTWFNRPKIPPTHFSMLDQMTLRLLAPLEDQGYILPDNMMPDIALGLMFSRWLRENGHDPDSFPTYPHEFLDHRPTVPARLYPNELITNFNLQLDTWLRDGRPEDTLGTGTKTRSFHRITCLPRCPHPPSCSTPKPRPLDLDSYDPSPTVSALSERNSTPGAPMGPFQGCPPRVGGLASEGRGPARAARFPPGVWPGLAIWAGICAGTEGGGGGAGGIPGPRLGPRVPDGFL